MVNVRKGFTLVELLIVIVIIGILSSAMMLSSGSATDSAEASNIVSNLRNTKAAVLMYYADNIDSLTTSAPTGALNVILAKYMDNPQSLSTMVLSTGTGQLVGRWMLGVPVGKVGVAEKLAGRAGKAGVIGSSSLSSVPSSTDTFLPAHRAAWMVAR